MPSDIETTDFIALEKDLEQQELESPGGIATAQLYSQLLGIYLLHNDICNAKYLWKRIPDTLKKSTPELGLIWAVGQKMWQRDFPGIYETVKKDWSDTCKPVMTAVLEATRRKAINLVSRAYSSINADDFATFVGLPVSEAVQAATAEKWEADPQTRIITPKEPSLPPDVPMPNEQQLSVLTDYVAFLEN